MTEALQSSQHFKRITTAITAVILAGIAYYFFDILSIKIFAGLIAVAASYEALEMLLDRNQAAGLRRWKIFSSLILTVLFYSSVVWPNFFSQWVMVLYPYAAILVFFGQAILFANHDNCLSLHLKDAVMQLFALIYIPGLLIWVPGVYLLPNGPIWFVLLLVSVWAGDIAAYYGGKTFGRHKLSPNLSPGKTREGSLSSLIFVTVLALMIGGKFLPELSVWKPAVIVAGASLVGQLGDLIKSLIKRVAGVKDSGSLFPGHGGAFDRFDSLILAAPVFYLLVAVLV